MNLQSNPRGFMTVGRIENGRVPRERRSRGCRSPQPILQRHEHLGVASHASADLTMSEVFMPWETGSLGAITATSCAAWQHWPISASPEYEARFSLPVWRTSKRGKPVENILLISQKFPLPFLALHC